MEGIDPSKRLSDLRRDSLLIFFLGLGIFTAALDGEFISLQARFALFAQALATTLCFYLIYSADIYGKRKCLWFTGTEPLHGDLCSLNGNFGIGLRGYMK